MRCVTKIDLGFRLQRQGLDLRVLFLQPLLDQGLVALQGAMQRLRAGDAELGQKPPHRNKAQGDLEFVLDQFGDHLAGPQRESELHLQQFFCVTASKMCILDPKPLVGEPPLTPST